MGKGVILADEEVVGRALGDVDGVPVADGEAGSAAARARKTEWVLRERSAALGFAWRAMA